MKKKNKKTTLKEVKVQQEQNNEVKTETAPAKVQSSISREEVKAILQNSKLVDNFVASVESLPILLTQHKAELHELKIQYSERKFGFLEYLNRKRTAVIKFREKERNMRALDNNFKETYIALSHTKMSKHESDALARNYTIIHEMLSCLGDHNTKYFKRDMIEYDNMKYKPILFVRNLTKYYLGKDQPNIDCLNFNVFPGEFHAFIGANGAGKTTTIKSLITSYNNWSGTILINGLKNLSEAAKKKIGYIPEKASFPENFSTYNYLKWMVMLSGLKTKDAEKVVEKQLRDIGMWNMRNRSPNTFSSGQKKKVLLLQTLIHNPDIIIMDEPVANLDPKARIDFFDKLLQLKAQHKA
ncbi:MAG: ABC transporter ATP-binding protein, partial [Malacoplasma sp.]|nr:ABC transporter ATP-binding protein [Malacoplasma sp.]